ncbi:DUF6973 domain-containing protein [Algoriella xinjiangensis]|nr:hypothetical protein [Algoriella xinjiangensis]
MLHKNASFLEKNNEVNSIVNEINNLQKSDKSSKSSNDSDFIIHKENITYIRTPDGERESYTFFVEKEYKRNLNFVENLVLSKKKNSDKYEAILITYFFPDGYMIDNKDFQVLKTMPLNIDLSLFNKSSTPLNKTSGGGCSYSIIETEHKCYSGRHSGSGQYDDCDKKGGTGPYSTYELYLSCDGGSGGGGGYNPGEPGGSSGGTETGPPGSGGNNGSGGANNGIETGITLPPSCQGTNCDEVVLPNQINTLLGKKLNISQLMFLYNNENIANHLFSILNNYNTHSQETYLWVINYLSHIDNISAADYFNQNPQDLEVLFYFSSNGEGFIQAWLEELINNTNEYPLNNTFYIFQYDYKSQMSTEELNIFNTLSPQSQFKYLKNAYNALNKAASLYPYSTHNGKGDAFRHAYFNTLNVISIGKYYTEKLTTAHENRPPNYAFAFKETNMDLFNNNVGRNYGDLILAGNSSSAENLIKLALQNGELMYLTPLGNDNCPTCANDISKLTPTNQ